MPNKRILCSKDRLFYKNWKVEVDSDKKKKEEDYTLSSYRIEYRADKVHATKQEKFSRFLHLFLFDAWSMHIFVQFCPT